MSELEIDFVVLDCLLARKLYEELFSAECIEATDLEKGQNEVTLKIGGVRLHLLDENPEYQLFAPKPGVAVSLWINLTVEDLDGIFEKAQAIGCLVVQGIKEFPDSGVINAIIQDPFGYVWMITKKTTTEF